MLQPIFHGNTQLQEHVRLPVTYIGSRIDKLASLRRQLDTIEANNAETTQTERELSTTADANKLDL